MAVARRKVQREGGTRRPRVEPQPYAGLTDLVGHLPAVASLRHQMASRSLSHAYWVSGPPQVGKTTLALAMASELLGAAMWPGGLLSHPDLWLDDGAGTLKIERIRLSDSDAESEEGPTLQHFLSLSAFAGAAKVAVIGNAERLSPPAANSLLRLLEEPRPNTVIWLCTARPDSEHLPSTLRSRCQQLLLGPVEAEAIAEWLVSRHGIRREAARVAAAICLGRPGTALGLVADRQLARRATDQLEQLLECPGQSASALLELSRKLAERGTERDVTRSALRVWASFLRDCCLEAAGVSHLSRWPDQAAQAREWAARLGPEGCSRRYDLALDALARLDEMATQRLVLDRFLLLAFGKEPADSPGGDRKPALSASDPR
ncbi:MAG TPA: AAA family ATPase [Candidatus Dormibacteraeota bacterium]|nr:AAA family ATPase [Candidatus Dormibacteraeota bacterium]